MAKIKLKVYGASWCSYCQEAKKALETRMLPFEYIDVTDNPAELARIKDLHGTLPMISVHKVRWFGLKTDHKYVVGGHDDLLEALPLLGLVLS